MNIRVEQLVVAKIDVDLLLLVLTAAVVHVGQAVAGTKRKRFNSRDTDRDSHTCQTGAKFKCFPSNGSDALANSHAGQAAATEKYGPSNGSDTVGNVYAGQTVAKCECAPSNSCDAVGNSNAGQTFATEKCIISNAGGAVFDNYCLYFLTVVIKGAKLLAS